jgi:hypothetical protein
VWTRLARSSPNALVSPTRSPVDRLSRRRRQAGIAQSMGSIGDSGALAESSFASLECELVDRSRWRGSTGARVGPPPTRRWSSWPSGSRPYGSSRSMSAPSGACNPSKAAPSPSCPRQLTGCCGDSALMRCDRCDTHDPHGFGALGQCLVILGSPVVDASARPGTAPRSTSSWLARDLVHGLLSTPAGGAGGGRPAPSASATSAAKTRDRHSPLAAGSGDAPSSIMMSCSAHLSSRPSTC